MNRIEMYASSAQLKVGLQRVLAVAYPLTHPAVAGETLAWWTVLEEGDRALGRRHALGLDALARTYGRPDVQSMIDAARGALSLAPLDHGLVGHAFRAAIISGNAHRAHGGRDVYGSSNKGLWDLVCADFGRAVTRHFGSTLGDDPVALADSVPTEAAVEELRALCAFDTSPDGADHDACVAWLDRCLAGLGFTVELIKREGTRPLVVAHRPARGLAGHVVLYGHYDVTPFGREQKWTFPPRMLTQSDGRLHARGVADNKGPLACRLAAVGALDVAPALTWLIQGEEETGSALAHSALPGILRALAPTLWLDETGYHDHEDGTLRLLARMLGDGDTSLPPDDALTDLLCGLRGLASRWGVNTRLEHRGLNKNVVEGGCPFNRCLPTGARYLAIGVNDSRARIHGVDESLPAWTFPLHAAQLDVVFRWANRVAGKSA